VSGAMSME